MPGTPDDEQADETAHQWVCCIPAIKRHDDARENCAERAERVTDDMKPCPAHIQVIFMIAVQEPGANQVDDESACRNYHHQAAPNFGRLRPALVSFVKNEQ